MPVSASFYRSARALRADPVSGPMGALALGLAVLGLWLFWSLSARVTRYEVSDSARLEVSGAAYPVQARVAGRVVTSHLVLGQEVHAGDILVQLESDRERLDLAEEQTRLRTLQPEIDALKAQSGVLEEGRKQERTVLSVTLEEARANYREAEAQWKQAEVDGERTRRLYEEKLVSESEYQKARADVQTKHAAAESLQNSVARLDPELRVREADREGRDKQFLADATKIDAQIATSSATIRKLSYEIERRRIRAPIDGRLGECVVLRPGGYISEGQNLGVILPGGTLRVVADFPPASLGRMRPGQPATVRLNGFPWAQYGTIAAQVDKVAGEIRDGHVRAEFVLVAGSRSPIPLQHGLPGSVEVAIERISPMALILRTAGRMAAGH